MTVQDWRDMLESYPAADEADWLRHATAFVAAFVTPAKRERWLWLLTTRPRRVGRDSHKMHADLDRRTCRSVSCLADEALRPGLYYRFADVPRVLPGGAVALADGAGDAIFSVVPGELAVYFFHERERWLCRAPARAG